MAYNKETGMWEGFIYKIWNDVNDKIYIGMTSQTPECRFYQHLKEHRRTDQTHIGYFDKIIGELGSENFHYTILKLLTDSNKDHLIMMLKKFEKYYIKKYKSNLYGYNISAGGDDYCIYNKPVWQYDLDGNFLNEYESITQAANITGIYKTEISHCCNKKRIKRTGEFLWAFKGEKCEPYVSRVNKSVTKYDLDGNYIQTYECVNSISQDKKMRRKIRDCCSGYKYSVNGFVYRYENDPFNKYPTEYKYKTWFKKGIKNGEEEITYA